MSKKLSIALLIIGILLVINGVGNMIDDARVLVYDITATLTGVGFILISRMKS